MLLSHEKRRRNFKLFPQILNTFKCFVFQHFSFVAKVHFAFTMLVLFLLIEIDINGPKCNFSSPSRLKRSLLLDWSWLNWNGPSEGQRASKEEWNKPSGALRLRQADCYFKAGMENEKLSDLSYNEYVFSEIMFHVLLEDVEIFHFMFEIFHEIKSWSHVQFKLIVGICSFMIIMMNFFL